MANILQKGAPVLGQTAREVPLDDIGSPEIQAAISQMVETVEACEDGVALAAPQIGLPYRIFVVAKRAFKDGVPVGEELVYVNPVLTRLSKEKKSMDEGCLSIRNWFGRTKRSVRATATAYNEKGKKFERGASGLLAQIFQHETDHLNGHLFDEKAQDLVFVSDEERNKE